eukprot:CAMPEP_0179991384 /NCGR_PEP_ID=MMETSP0984-20121128/4957_1 /TAXON_ID=483367 /ORGANISM="non described non described, Strain CCMP 2436" /LENGTH=150 /DNA_ID=CAMNT_0021910673 /DNA_START=54 /DNA_END=506 /DNA_ORIENTATION=+
MGVAQKFAAISSKLTKEPASKPGSKPAAKEEATGFASAPLFAQIGELLKDPEICKKAPAVFQFVITKGPSDATASWVVDGKAGEVREGTAAKADCTLTLSDADFVLMVSGKLPAQRAFMMGKLKIAGNMGVAQKFAVISSKLTKGQTSKL